MISIEKIARQVQKDFDRYENTPYPGTHPDYPLIMSEAMYQEAKEHNCLPRFYRVTKPLPEEAK